MRFLVACGLLASLCVAATAQQFDCPIDASFASCHSYQELLAARDKQVVSEDVAFACFDKFEDRFFLINAESPVFQEKINDGKAHREDGFVGMVTFVNGVEDDSALPYASVTGKSSWVYSRAFGPRFRFKYIKSMSDSLEVAMSSSNISLDQDYIGKTDKKIHYNLTIQRSTGRFTESFVFKDAPKLNQGSSGRCVPVNTIENSRCRYGAFRFLSRALETGTHIPTRTLHKDTMWLGYCHEVAPVPPSSATGEPCRELPGVGLAGQLRPPWSNHECPTFVAICVQ